MAGVLINGNIIKVNAAYDGEKAADYAVEHAASDNYNKDYHKFDSDCTNFVSQCVYTGGIEQEEIDINKVKYTDLNDVWKTKSKWCYTKVTRKTELFGYPIYKKTGWVCTSTWSVVSKESDAKWYGFYNYMTKECGYKSKNMT